MTCSVDVCNERVVVMHANAPYCLAHWRQIVRPRVRHRRKTQP